MKRRLDLGSPRFKQKLVSILIRNTPATYILTDMSFRVLFVNDRLLHLRGLKKEEVLGKICYEVCNGGVPCSNCAVRDALYHGQPARILRKDILADGSAVHKDDLAIPLKIEGWEGLVLEIQLDRTLEIQLREKTNHLFMEIIHSLIKILEKKDFYTSQHSQDVSAISSKLTWYMGLGERAVFNATLGGLLHDLGKLHVPDAVLNKNGRLDDREYAIIKEHPMFTYLLLPDVDSFRTIRDIAIAHHEKWDGTGYPNGLKGTDIPIEARIASVADTYSAMTGDRTYRKGLPHEKAVEEIKNCSGTQFDPDIAAKFTQMVDEFFLDKETLTCPDESTLFENLNLHQCSPRKLTGVPRGEESPPSTVFTNAELAELAASDAFVDAIIDNTPATYMIIDESFNIMYVSDSYALSLGQTLEELVGQKCFDATDRKMSCFRTEHANIRCPAVRAFSTGQSQVSLLEETIAGQTFYYDAHAIPIDLDDVNGEAFKCCLIILFDRTKEKNAQLGFENDLKQVINIVYNMISELDLNVSGNIAEMSAEADSFGDFLNRVQAELSDIISAGRNPNPSGGVPAAG